MMNVCLNVRRDPACSAGEETAQGVQCQEGPRALAAPVHPGQQPLPGGHQEALPASDHRELSEWKPQPQHQGGEQKGGSSQGGRGCHQQLTMKDFIQRISWFLGKFCYHIICLSLNMSPFCQNKCTYCTAIAIVSL